MDVIIILIALVALALAALRWESRALTAYTVQNGNADNAGMAFTIKEDA